MTFLKFKLKGCKCKIDPRSALLFDCLALYRDLVQLVSFSFTPLMLSLAIVRWEDEGHGGVKDGERRYMLCCVPPH